MVQSTGNFFCAHAYTHRFCEPFTHTGVLGTFRWYENLSNVGGPVNGWDGFDRPADTLGGLGGITYSPQDGSWSLVAFAISTEEPNATATMSPLTMYSVIFTYDLTEDLQWVAQHDCGWQKNAQASGQAAEWYSLVNYVYYALNDCWKAGLRAEWFRDDDGVRVNGVRPGNPNQAPYIGNFYEITAGLDWTPAANFRIRPELRGDWFSGNGRPFNDGNRTF